MPSPQDVSKGREFSQTPTFTALCRFVRAYEILQVHCSLAWEARGTCGPREWTTIYKLGKNSALTQGLKERPNNMYKYDMKCVGVDNRKSQGI